MIVSGESLIFANNNGKHLNYNGVLPACSLLFVLSGRTNPQLWILQLLYVFSPHMQEIPLTASVSRRYSHNKIFGYVLLSQSVLLNFYTYHTQSVFRLVCNASQQRNTIIRSWIQYRRVRCQNAAS